MAQYEALVFGGMHSTCLCTCLSIEQEMILVPSLLQEMLNTILE